MGVSPEVVRATGVAMGDPAVDFKEDGRLALPLGLPGLLSKLFLRLPPLGLPLGLPPGLHVWLPPGLSLWLPLDPSSRCPRSPTNKMQGGPLRCPPWLPHLLSSVVICGAALSPI